MYNNDTMWELMYKTYKIVETSLRVSGNYVSNQSYKLLVLGTINQMLRHKKKKKSK